MAPPLISLEEHFFSSAAPSSLHEKHAEQLRHIPNVLAQLTDLGPRHRLPDMDAGGIALQVVSHAPGLGVHDAALSRATNDQLAKAIDEEDRRAGGGRKKGRGRLAGFAAVPMADPEAAGAELRRAVMELGFVGALIDNHCNGKFYEGPEYDVWWAAVEELGVPVYLHPSWPSEDMRARYCSPTFTEATAGSLASSGWGWHTETGLHVLRLFASGLFDRRRGLKIVVGHMGEMIPFMLQRIAQLSRRWGTFERDFGTVYRENIWVTTSGDWSLDPLRCILANTRLDHILYSVDYPFVSNEVGLRWIQELEKSGLVDEEGLKGIAYKNAE